MCVELDVHYIQFSNQVILSRYTTRETESDFDIFAMEHLLSTYSMPSKIVPA